MLNTIGHCIPLLDTTTCNKCWIKPFVNKTRWQHVNELGTSSANTEHILITSCWNSIGTCLLQVYKLRVFTCVLDSCTVKLSQIVMHLSCQRSDSLAVSRLKRHKRGSWMNEIDHAENDLLINCLFHCILILLLLYTAENQSYLYAVSPHPRSIRRYLRPRHTGADAIRQRDAIFRWPITLILV